MKEVKWVQHISGEGEKWEVSGRLYNSANEADWQVIAKNEKDDHHYLPKSEYRLCDPPEVWEDVTDQCEITPTGFVRIINADGTHTYIEHDKGYRFSKVPRCPHHVMPPAECIGKAFIVERRKS